MFVTFVFSKCTETRVEIQLAVAWDENALESKV